MRAVKSLDYIAVDDYLESEQVALIKHEYVYGQVYAMAEASDFHNRITLNTAAILNEASFKHSCVTYMSDMKVKVEKEIFYYPDVMVICKKHNNVNDYYKEKPCLIVEIFSKLTERIDRQEKLQAYLAMSNLQTYLMINSRKKVHYRLSPQKKGLGRAGLSRTRPD